MPKPTERTLPLRLDIQALRGLAVTAVILFHSGIGIAPSGYLGVDMFFVISGYLITGIILRQKRADQFTFQAFYLRRIRRLLPAAYVVLLSTLILSIFLLTNIGFARYFEQFLGSLTFSTNIVLWKQINYFNNDAVFEPLLHMWSLAVEEQYYIVFPIALLLLPKRLWLAGILIATLASLCAYCWLYPRSPGVAFYLLPTRAWEIGLGSLATFVAPASRLARWARRLAPVAALCVVGICFVPGGFLASYLLAIPACIAAAILILVPHDSPSIRRRIAPIARIGDFSYSLYLVHWPLFAFAHTIYVRVDLPIWLSLAIIGLTFVLAFMLYRFVEEPIHRSATQPRRTWMIALVASIALAGGCAVVLHVKQRSAPNIDLVPITDGLENPFCRGDGNAIDPRCSQGKTPEILIWGDSLSQAITPGIVATTAHPIVQASKGQCAPLPGLAPVDRDSPLGSAEQCLAFNDSVLAYLARTPSIRVVVLTGRYARLMFDGTQAMSRAADGTTRVGPAEIEAMVASQSRTTAAIRAMGKRVLLIAPPPQANFDVGACWSRILGKLPVFPAALRQNPSCAITRDGAIKEAAEGRRLMQAFAQRARTPVLRLDTMMCSGGVCPTSLDNRPLYVDAVHLSRTGSILVGKRFSIGQSVWEQAR